MAYEGRDEQPPDDDPVGSVAEERVGLEEDSRVQRSEEELRTGGHRGRSKMRGAAKGEKDG